MAAGTNPPPPPPPSSVAHHVKNESRESSEFEFLGGNGGKSPVRTAPPQATTQHTMAPSSPVATLPTEQPATVTATPTAASVVTPESTKKSPNVRPPSVDDDDGGGGGSILFGFLSKVAEKTKNSVETIITTVDPQMKDYIYSGGDVEIVVASEADSKVVPVKEAFQKVFGRATVVGMKPHPSGAIAEQPVGYAAGRQGAIERIQNFRSKKAVPDDAVLVSVEGFLLEVGEESWVELSCLVLSDAARKIQLTTYTQSTPVDPAFVAAAKSATPDSYPRRWSGLKETVGAVIARAWSVPAGQWHEAVCGVERSEMIGLAAKTLAGMYQRALWSSQQCKE